MKRLNNEEAEELREAHLKDDREAIDRLEATRRQRFERELETLGVLTAAASQEQLSTSQEHGSTRSLRQQYRAACANYQELQRLTLLSRDLKRRLREALKEVRA